MAHRQPLCRVPRRLQRPSLGRSLLAIVEALITWSADHISDVQQARGHHDTNHFYIEDRVDAVAPHGQEVSNPMQGRR